MSDRDLPRQIARIWIEIQPSVFAYVSSMVPHYADADDVVQRVAMAMIDNFEQRDPATSPLAWALGIARHKIADHYRARSRDRLIFKSESLDLIERAYGEIEEETGELRAALAECVRQLTGKQREAVTLRYGEGLKAGAIAERLGLTGPVVSNLLVRARAALRRCTQQRLGVDTLEADA